MTEFLSPKRLRVLSLLGCTTRLVFLALLVLGCTETREFNGWLRVHETDEITIIPHMFTLGGDPAIIEVRVGDEWMPVLSGVRQHIWPLTSDAVLTELDTSDGVAFFLLREGHRQPVKRWSSDNAEMELTPERGFLLVVWSRSRSRLEMPDRVRVEVFDSYGLTVGTPRELRLPQRPDCYFDRLDRYEDGVAILGDSCNRESLALTYPEPTRMAVSQ